MVAGRQFSEPVMTLAEAAGWFDRRFGRRPNVASIWRWATKGSKGVRLETISLGRFRYTTEGALERFVAETSRRDAGQHRVAEASENPPAADATSRFTAAEVTAATRRREQEKAKAIEYLQSRVGSAGRTRRTVRDAGNGPEGQHS
jgi:hypothetical protein